MVSISGFYSSICTKARNSPEKLKTFDRDNNKILSMDFGHSRTVRDDIELANLPTINGDSVVKMKEKMPSRPRSKESERKGKSLKEERVSSRIVPENYEMVKKKLLNPHGHAVNKWNKIFLVACLVSLFVDPMFFYMPIVHGSLCIATATRLEIILMALRSTADLFYVLQIVIKFRTVFMDPPYCVFGRGELVLDSAKIAVKYLTKDFWIDFIVALPLPQVFISTVIPSLGGSAVVKTRRIVAFIVLFQYFPRIFVLYPLSSKVVQATGVVAKTAWAGAAYNFILYMLTSHIIGACYYLLSLDRQAACFRSVCNTEAPICQHDFFNCHKVNDTDRASWFQVTNISSLCSPSQGHYPYGIYAGSVTNNVTNSAFVNKFWYCFWWGLQNVSTFGQNLVTTTYAGEIYFCLCIGVMALILFTSFLANMQSYFRSFSVRLEEWRVKRTDTEHWMHHRQLPHELRESVRTYGQFKWVATRGVNEEALLQDLPLHLRRKIKRHLCYDSVRRVPLFKKMDEQMLDAICERLKPCFCTKGTYQMLEGDPVHEMVFIIRGNLDSYTTNGGRTGFFNSCHIGPGDFCGEELLTWALESHPIDILPSSTRTIKAISEVEAFALAAEDLKFVATQYRRLHSKQLRHKFRFYSHQWRTWGACYIQAAWRRYKKRKISGGLDGENNAAAAAAAITTHTSEFALNGYYSETSLFSSSAEFSLCDAILEASHRRGLNLRIRASSSDGVNSLQKPKEPDFSLG